MASIEKLLNEKAARLESIPDALLTRIERIQKQVLPQVLDLVMLLERDADGFILLNDSNLNIVQTAQQQLRDVLLTSDYTEAVADFAEEFDVQKGVNNELFKATFTDFVTSGSLSRIVSQSKADAVDLFINGITDDAFADAIRDTISQAVYNNAGWKDTVEQIQTLVTGNDEIDGKLLQYSKQVAHDQFALADRSYTSAVANEVGAEWFKYLGNIITTSRPFCRERHNKFYYYREIESWAKEDWAGKMDGTNAETIFATAGGWNCRHSIVPVSIASVPITVIQEAMINWGFEPTDFEREELGL